MKWGLVPNWSKDPSGAAGMINARSETAATKPAFHDPLKYRRCLIPADAFYEWKRNGTSKQPYCFEVNNPSPFEPLRPRCMRPKTKEMPTRSFGGNEMSWFRALPSYALLLMGELHSFDQTSRAKRRSRQEQLLQGRSGIPLHWFESQSGEARKRRTPQKLEQQRT